MKNDCGLIQKIKIFPINFTYSYYYYGILHVTCHVSRYMLQTLIFVTYKKTIIFFFFFFVSIKSTCIQKKSKKINKRPFDLSKTMT